MKKICKKCGKEKDLYDFGANIRELDKKSIYCLKCKREMDRDARLKRAAQEKNPHQEYKAYKVDINYIYC